MGKVIAKLLMPGSCPLGMLSMQAQHGMNGVLGGRIKGVVTAAEAALPCNTPAVYPCKHNTLQRQTGQTVKGGAATLFQPLVSHEQLGGCMPKQKQHELHCGAGGAPPGAHAAAGLLFTNILSLHPGKHNVMLLL